MTDLKLYSIDDLKKMSEKDRAKLLTDMVKVKAELTLNVRTGKEKQNHLIRAWKKQIARTKTLNHAK